MTIRPLLIAALPVLVSPSLADIHGEDDRYEPYELSNAAIREYCDAVAVLVPATLIDEDGNFLSGAARLSEIQVRTETSEGVQLRPVHPNERFASQPLYGTCTGFLVAPDLLVTAGHCLEKNSDCKDNYWVFGYELEAGTQRISRGVGRENIYQCAEIIHSTGGGGLHDYALVRLDRPVTGRTPLEFRREGTIPDDANLVMIGYPLGLPMKVADRGRIRPGGNANDEYFVTNLDSFAGNSGSPVINVETGVVEGIHYAGSAETWTEDLLSGRARVIHVEAEFGGTGCQVERITNVPALMERLGERRSLLELVKVGDSEAVSREIQAGSDLTTVKDGEKRNLLHLAMQGGHPEIVWSLMGAGVPTTARDAYGNTPLHYGALHGVETCVRILLREDIPVNVVNELGATPLYYATQGAGFAARHGLITRDGFERVKTALEERGASPALQPHYRFDHILREAFETRRLEEVLAHDSVDLWRYEGALLRAVAFSGSESGVEELLAHPGFRPDCTYSTLTALDLALVAGNYEVVELLRAAGVPHTEAGAAAVVEAEGLLHEFMVAIASLTHNYPWVNADGDFRIEFSVTQDSATGPVELHNKFWRDWDDREERWSTTAIVKGDWRNIRVNTQTFHSEEDDPKFVMFSGDEVFFLPSEGPRQTLGETSLWFSAKDYSSICRAEQQYKEKLAAFAPTFPSSTSEPFLPEFETIRAAQEREADFVQEVTAGSRGEGDAQADGMEADVATAGGETYSEAVNKAADLYHSAKDATTPSERSKFAKQLVDHLIANFDDDVCAGLAHSLIDDVDDTLPLGQFDHLIRGMIQGLELPEGTPQHYQFMAVLRSLVVARETGDPDDFRETKRRLDRYLSDYEDNLTADFTWPDGVRWEVTRLRPGKTVKLLRSFFTEADVEPGEVNLILSGMKAAVWYGLLQGEYSPDDVPLAVVRPSAPRVEGEWEIVPVPGWPVVSNDLMTERMNPLWNRYGVTVTVIDAEGKILGRDTFVTYEELKAALKELVE